MLVLALDTTTRQGSVALVRDGRTIGVHLGEASITHGERLPGDLLRVLEPNHLSLTDVDVFAVAAGPGSFTGLRIGIAAMQGLALAGGKPLVGISALDALHDTLTDSEVVPAPRLTAIWMDAQRGQVFSSVFGPEGATTPDVGLPGEIFSRWDAAGLQPLEFGGDGAARYADEIARQFPHARVRQPVPPLAPAVGRLAWRQALAGGPFAPDAIRPLYVRRSDAELARDRLKPA